MNMKDENNMTRFTELGSPDPAVDLLIDQGDRRQADAVFQGVNALEKRKSESEPRGASRIALTWICPWN